jgi:hypothetical protein
VADSPINEWLRSVQRSAMHLEMRDNYTPDDPDWRDWREGRPFDPAERYRGWFDLISETVGRGVEVRRARIVSEPVTDYIRFEYDATAGLNVAAGEQVRWLPRRRAADMPVPGCDFWVFDERVVMFNHFDGPGNWVDVERRDDPALARLMATAFEAIWERATPHGSYQPA